MIVSSVPLISAVLIRPWLPTAGHVRGRAAHQFLTFVAGVHPLKTV